MRCYVCDTETRPRQRYCDQCRIFFRRHRENLKRRTALREAYDRDNDAFRDHWSGVILEEKDQTDPFHLCFDHLLPTKASRLVVSSDLFNHMKYELVPDEFTRVIRELATHRTGRRFDKECIEFTHWGVRAPSPPRPKRRPRRRKDAKAPISACFVCGQPSVPWSCYCARCGPYVRWKHRDYRVRAKALKRAWSAEEDGFLCHYTGVKVELDDPGNPWYLSFDHGIPGDKETLIVAAFWVNMMKHSLSEAEFWAVVLEYDRYLREGGEFDRDVVDFKYWRLARKLRE